MRVSLVVSLIVLAGTLGATGACITAPNMSPLPDGTVDTDIAADAASVTTPAITDDGAPPTEEVDAEPADDDAGLPDEPGTPDPPGTACPAADAPTGTSCCGAASGPPPCIGEACKHCADCTAKSCGGGSICCAYTAGKSGKYKGILCAPANLAHLCP